MIRELLKFYLNPFSYFNVGSSDTSKQRTVLLKNTLLFCIFSSVLIVFVTRFTVEKILKYTLDISILDNLSYNRGKYREINGYFLTYLKTSVFGPFEEEILFRLPLITRSTFLIFVIFLGWAEHILPDPFRLNFFSMWYNIILAVIAVAVIIDDKTNRYEYPPILDKGRYNNLCWVSILVFALVHIGNFTPLNWSIIYLYPFYVLPQFVYGVVLSYLAIRYNSIVWPFLLHVAINSTAEVPKLLTYLF